MTYRGPWNAAGTRHRQTLRRYKACGPVGDYLHVNAHLSELDIRNDIGDCVSCPGCGHLLCSCQNLAYEPPVYASGGSSPKQYAKRIADEVLKQAHRASMQPQGGTAATTCDHWDMRRQGCEVCDPLAKVRQASERVRSSLQLGDEVIYTSTERPECYGMRGRVTYITVSGDMVTVSCTMGSLVGFKAADFSLAAEGP